jgi:ATP/maltotriose-dependent transcriptional regulator MalT
MLEIAHLQLEAKHNNITSQSSNELTERDGDLFVHAAYAAARRYRLTVRERQILDALLRGHSSRAMAERLKITVATVKWHLHNLYAKLGVENRDAAFRKALCLEDPRWLLEPLRDLNTHERLVEAAEHVVHASKSDWRGRSTTNL